MITDDGSCRHGHDQSDDPASPVAAQFLRAIRIHRCRPNPPGTAISWGRADRADRADRLEVSRTCGLRYSSYPREAESCSDLAVLAVSYP